MTSRSSVLRYHYRVYYPACCKTDYFHFHPANRQIHRAKRRNNPGASGAWMQSAAFCSMDGTTAESGIVARRPTRKIYFG
ncbi:MAG: hypothetical protein ACYDEJ_02920 [Desulfitobacteriaceae bacterium]